MPDVIVTVADPTGLSANAVSATQVNLGWTDNASNETNYLVQRSTDGGATWTNLATLAADSTNYSDTTVSASSSYLYRVQAYNATLSSNYSNTATATTPAVPTVPATPINVAGSAVFAKFSRDDEAQADAAGVDELIRAGINPNGMNSSTLAWRSSRLIGARIRFHTPISDPFSAPRCSAAGAVSESWA